MVRYHTFWKEIVLDCWFEAVDELILHSEQHQKCSIEVEFQRVQEGRLDAQESRV